MEASTGFPPPTYDLRHKLEYACDLNALDDLEGRSRDSELEQLLASYMGQMNRLKAQRDYGTMLYKE
jgi:hypothetical protein